MKKFIKLISVALLTVFTALCFTACVPSTIEKAKEKMEGLSYSVSSVDYISSDDFASTFLGIGYGVDNLEAGAKKITATLDSESLTIFYFENKKDAERFFELYVVLKQDANRWNNIDQQGKMVCFGSNKAYNDFIG
jgi:hypothetical protein